jgi:hypothetical protein
MLVWSNAPTSGLAALGFSERNCRDESARALKKGEIISDVEDLLGSHDENASVSVRSVESIDGHSIHSTLLVATSITDARCGGLIHVVGT